MQPVILEVTYGRQVREEEEEGGGEGEKVLTVQQVFLVRHDVIRVSGMRKLLRFKSTGPYGDARDGKTQDQ